MHVCLFTGEVGAGSAAVAAAAAQAAIATLPMQPGRRGSGALKAPYAATLGTSLFTAGASLVCLVEPREHNDCVAPPPPPPPPPTCVDGQWKFRARGD